MTIGCVKRLAPLALTATIALATAVGGLVVSNATGSPAIAPGPCKAPAKWHGNDANNYEINCLSCKVFGPQKVAKDLHMRSTNPVDVAEKVSMGYRRGFRQAVFEGCLRGFELRANPAGTKMHAKPAAKTPTISAGGAFARQMQWMFNGQFDRLYNTLVVEQRRIVRRELFLDCWQRSRPKQEIEVKKWKTIDSLRVKLTIPGTQRKLWTTAVTVRLTVRDRTTAVTTDVTVNAHQVNVGGQWHWMIPQKTMSALMRGRCA